MMLLTEFWEGGLLPFLLGAVLAALIAWRMQHRWHRVSEEKHREALAGAGREAHLAAREAQARAELELTRQRHELENEMARHKMQLDLRGQQVDSAERQVQADLAEVEQKRTQLEGRAGELDRRLAEVETLQQGYRRKIEEVVQLDPEAVKAGLREEVQRECEDDLRELKDRILHRGENAVREEARRILLAAMQRLSAAPIHDITATIVPLSSEAMKGRLIGREGRNIKAFESATGTTLLIDETPDSVLISSFDPVRREIAKLALLHLMKDGRIHPSSIEEAVVQATEQMKQSVTEFGEEALRRTRVNHVHPEIVSLLGKMRFRLSNNQNSLEHSVEVANLSSLLAAEMKLDPEIARRAGLFHDIGKSIEGEYEGSHALAAARILKRHGEDERIVNAVAAHHEEVPPESPYAAILMIADSISAMRPGARSENLDSYLQRVANLESLARGLPGVQEAYAVQAGREIRVVVLPEKVTDEQARGLARDLRHRIEEQLQYPGSIKITIIRESRFVEVAK